ncbi:MAG: hypothetical protein HFE97_12330 [Oscillospiraceae bacterium]|nr:hypothetical protein [Oscillospiraceae bacterium]
MSELREIKKLMRHNLIESYRGWWIWHRLVKRYHLGRTRVVLLPSVNRAYSYPALLYIDQMLERHSYETAIILSVDPVVQRAAPLFSQRILAVETITRKKAERLMQFYCLYEFDARFVVASLDEPNGRNAAGLIGKNGTTAEELIAIGVYQLPDFMKEEAPYYRGEDPELISFLGKGDAYGT